MRVRAALSRDGVEVYGEASYLIIVLTLCCVSIQFWLLSCPLAGNSVNMQPMESRPILLQVNIDPYINVHKIISSQSSDKIIV